MMLLAIPFYQPSYWFTLEPPIVDGGLGHALFLFFLLLFIVGMAARIAGPVRTKDKQAKKAIKQISAMLITMGLLGVFLFFLSYEGARLFGARFWYPLWFVGFIAWGVYLYWFFKKKVPAMQKHYDRLKEHRAYLPKKKK